MQGKPRPPAQETHEIDPLVAEGCLEWIPLPEIGRLFEAWQIEHEVQAQSGHAPSVPDGATEPAATSGAQDDGA